jgi:hypothetical protein
MLGRGTRNLSACENREWLPTNKDGQHTKEDFLILDFKFGDWSNVLEHKLNVLKQKSSGTDAKTRIFLEQVDALEKKLSDKERKVVEKQIIDTVKEIDVKVNEISSYTLTNYTANLTIKEITSSVANLCGDGNLSAGEQCDGTKLNSSTCASILGTGYTGTLTCTASCTFNTTRCSAPATTPTIPTTPTNRTTTPATTPEEESNALLWIIIIFAVILIIALVIFFIVRKNRAGEQPAQPSPFISPRPPSFPLNRIPQLPPRPYLPQPARVPIVQQPRPIMLRQPIQPRPIITQPGNTQPQQPRQTSSQSQPSQGDLPPSPPR